MDTDSMKHYDTWIFDLDGTITDTTAVWIQIFRDCLKHVGVNDTAFTDTEIAKYTHDWNTVIKLGVDPDKVPAFAKYAAALANKRLPDAELFPNARETLQELRARGMRVGIFSAMDRDIFEPAMRHRQLYDVAEVGVAGTDVANRKPAPDGILKALADLGVPEQDFGTVAYMGDKDTDLQAAHSAGIDAILFFPPGHQVIYDKEAVLQHKPEAVITGWQDLLTLLQTPVV